MYEFQAGDCWLFSEGLAYARGRRYARMDQPLRQFRDTAPCGKADAERQVDEKGGLPPLVTQLFLVETLVFV